MKAKYKAGEKVLVHIISHREYYLDIKDAHLEVNNTVQTISVVDSRDLTYKLEYTGSIWFSEGMLAPVEDTVNNDSTDRCDKILEEETIKYAEKVRDILCSGEKGIFPSIYNRDRKSYAVKFSAVSSCYLFDKFGIDTLDKLKKYIGNIVKYEPSTSNSYLVPAVKSLEDLYKVWQRFYQDVQIKYQCKSINSTYTMDNGVSFTMEDPEGNSSNNSEGKDIYKIALINAPSIINLNFEI